MATRGVDPAFGHKATHLDDTRRPGKVIAEPDGNGITLLPRADARARRSRGFDVDYRSGAIHDFQDRVVLRPRARG
jgi:hypothetical protein